MGGYEISLSCRAFALLSRVPNVSVDCRLSLFTVCYSLSIHCCRYAPAFVIFLSFFLVAGVCLLLLLLYHPHESGLFSSLQPLLTLLSAWTQFFLFIVLLSRAHILPSLLDAVFSELLPHHDLTMLLPTYSLRLR